MITAQVVLINPDGLVLGVSRKHDHTDFGLIGGKMDPEDNNNPINTAIRECKEETGLDITNLRLVFAIHKNGNMGFTYLADYTGEINHDEPHVVEWLPFEVLVKGSFGKYNKMVSESLTDMGIKYIFDIDMDPLVEELEKFINLTIRKGYIKQFIFDGIYRNLSGWGSDFNITLIDCNGDDLDSEWDDYDDEYENNIILIGKKYHINIGIPSYYYKK